MRKLASSESFLCFLLQFSFNSFCNSMKLSASEIHARLDLFPIQHGYNLITMRFLEDFSCKACNLRRKMSFCNLEKNETCCNYFKKSFPRLFLCNLDAFMQANQENDRNELLSRQKYQSLEPKRKKNKRTRL